MQAIGVPKKKAQDGNALDSEVGKRLRRAREDLGYTGVYVAEQAGILPEALSRFERGQRGLEAKNLLRLLKTTARLGVSLDYVFGGSGPTTRSLIVSAETSELQAKLDELVELVRGGDSPRTRSDSSPTARKKRHKH